MKTLLNGILKKSETLWRLGLPTFKEWNGTNVGTAKNFRDFKLYKQTHFPIRDKVLKYREHLYRRLILFPIWRLRDLRLWFHYRFHPQGRSYTNIKLTRLQAGYYDADVQLLYAMFEIFERFMKRQFNDPRHVWEYTLDDFRAIDGEFIMDEDAVYQEIEKRNATWNEMKTLYDWWVNVRPNRKLPNFPKLPKDWGFMSPMNEDFEGTEEMNKWHEVANQRRKIEEGWNEEDEEMMHRLVKIHDVLWD